MAIRPPVRTRSALLAAIVALGTAGCDALPIEGVTAAERARLAAGLPDDVRGLAATGFRYWHYSLQGEEPSLALATMAQAYASSWDDFGMRRPGPAVSAAPWYSSYAALAAANLTLMAVHAGTPFPREEAQALEAAATFLQGASLSTVALLFDRGYVVTDSSSLGAPIPLSPRADVRDSALARLDRAVALAEAGRFRLSSTLLNTAGWTNQQVAQAARTMAARTLAYFARNAAETAEVDWARVAAYASAGIGTGPGFDLVIEGDNARWYDPYKAYGQSYNGWVRVDQRLVCLLDPSQPCRFPRSGGLPPPRSPDRRVLTDFIYTPTVPFDPMRGRASFSHVGHKRYRFHSFEDESGGGTGAMPFVLRAENDLLLAEALLRTGGRGGEVARLVNRTRVGRGGLPPLSGAEPGADLLAAIFYEREVELLGSGGGVPFFDRRRTDGLPAGVPRDFAVPAAERDRGAQAMYGGGEDLPAWVAGALAARLTWGGAAGGDTATAVLGRVFRMATGIQAANRRRLGIGRE